MNETGKGKNIAIIILIILVVGLSNFIIYDKFLAKDKNDLNNNTSTNTESNNGGQSQNPPEKVDGKGVCQNAVNLSNYNYPAADAKGDVCGSLLAFFPEDSNVINQSSIVANKNAIAYNYAQNKLVNSRDDYDFEKCLNNYEESCIVSKVSKVDFEKSYYNIWGNNKEIDYTTFTAGFWDSCKLDGNEIKCIGTVGGCIGGTTYYVDTICGELINNELIVYTRILTNAAGSLYSGYKTNNFIADVESDLSQEALFNQYGDKATKYKMTYKQNSDGSWYWYQTEKVN